MAPRAQGPVSATEHPPTWKFDLPVFHPADLGAWRDWLEHHHATERGVWVVSWRRPSGKPTVPYEQLVEEAICFGWIDSTVNTLDDERGMQLMTPRKAKSGWTRLNRQRFADLEAAGRMTDAGRAAAEAAKANGWWTKYDEVEDLVEPPELAAALDATPAARAGWDALAPSTRKQHLWAIVTAAKPETKAKRIDKIVADVAQAAPDAS